MIDIERPKCRAAKACEIAGVPVQTLREWRMTHGLRLGKLKGASGNVGYLFSTIDVAELCLIPVFRAMGYAPPDAVKHARDQRQGLRSVLIDRLAHGFWNLSRFEELNHESGMVRTLYFDQLVERVITKLALPLPDKPLPKNRDVAERMTNAILDYFFSPPGMIRWRKWRDSVLERGGKISFAQAAAELGAPEWFLRAVTKAEPRHDLIAIVAPRAPKVLERLEGVTLQ